MNTSTPLKIDTLKKLCLKNINSPSAELDVNSAYRKHETNNLSAVELEPGKSTAANTSVELFPFSPISNLRHVPSNLSPYLDSPNLRWSSSLCTSFGDGEVECISEMCPQNNDSDELKESDYTEMVNSQRHANQECTMIRETLDVLCSPVIQTNTTKHRNKKFPDAIVAKKSLCSIFSDQIQPPSGSGCSTLNPENIRHLDNNPFEPIEEKQSVECDISSEETKSSRSPLLKVKSKLDSKKFVYPSVIGSIKKPTSILRLDELTNNVLALEMNDSFERALSKHEFIIPNNTLVAFNELQSQQTQQDIKRCDGLIYDDGYVEKNECVEERNKNYYRVAKVVFEVKDDHHRWIQKRLNIVNKLHGEGDLIRCLYSMYYFVSRVHLSSYKKDAVYKQNAIEYFIRSSIFPKLKLSSSFVENFFDRIANDVYTLNRIGLMIDRLYVTYCNAFKYLGDIYFQDEEIFNEPMMIDSSPSGWHYSDHLSVNHKSPTTTETNPVIGIIGHWKASDIVSTKFAESFITESGKINVSAELLEKSKNQFSDIFDDSFDDHFKAPDASIENEVFSQKIDNSSIKSYSFTNTFQTGNGKPICVNNRALEKSKNIFSDVFDELPKCTAQDDEFRINFQKSNTYNDKSSRTTRSIRSTNDAPSSAFKTGTGKPINVKIAALQKTKDIFSDVFDDTENQIKHQDVTFPSTSRGLVIDENLHKFKTVTGKISSESLKTKFDFKAENCGFQTGSGKLIKVNEKSLEASKNIFSDVLDEPLKPQMASITTSNYGFQTGSGKLIKVNEKSLEASKNIFSDVLDEPAEIQISKRTRSGLQSGSGKLTNINVESPEVSRNIFSDLLEKPSEPLIPTKMSNCGFQTGSGKLIEVDAKSLLASKTIFSDVMDDPLEIQLVSKPSTKRGFQTGSGKSIEIDAKSIQASRNIFADVLDESSEPSLGPVKSSNIGFQTCSGKSIKVDAKSLLVSKSIFSDVLDEPVDSKDANYRFQTGSGKSINNAKSLLTSKNVFSDVLHETKNFGFQTGSGKLIDIDATSLLASKNIFSDVLDVPIDGADLKLHPEILKITTDVVEEKSLKSYSDTTSLKDSETTSLSSILTETTQNKSFDLSREIAESTSAFLYDVSNEHSFFAPGGNSTICADSNDTQTHEADSKRSISPVFDFKFAPSKCKRTKKRKRGSQSSLDITYVRKSTSENETNTSDEITHQLETLKSNFPSKSTKRKASPRVSKEIKKCKSSSSHERAAAAVHQRNYILNKPAEFCKPRKGYYSGLNEAQSRSRISLQQMSDYEKPKIYSYDEYLKFGLMPSVIRVNSQNAQQFIFTTQFLSDEQLINGASAEILFGDSVPIILNENNHITLEEISRGFLASPGVDPKLITPEWIANQYRWIVWKLASTERTFPRGFGGRYLTPDNVLFQLKFKYEQEIDKCVRSALKKILEGDDSAARPLILCVASIEKQEQTLNEHKVELTDGWYRIFAQIDDQMNDLITRKKLSIGSKLIITGAEVIGLKDPCDPLQINENVRLKFSTNSCRRVRWHTRLGFYTEKKTPINRISTVSSKGGLISHLSAVVARVYPLLFLEKDDDDGNSAPARLHNQRSEIKRMMAYEKDRQCCIESILSQVTDQVLRESASISKTDLDAVANFSNEDNERLRDVIQQRVQSNLPEKYSRNRKVTRLLKLRLVDPQDEQNKSSAILSIWNPSDDLIAFFKEDKLYEFFNLNTNNIRNGELQLCSNRQSKYNGGSAADCSNNWFRRRVTDVERLRERSESSTFDEIDLIGVIIRTQQKNEQNRTIYAADLQRRFFAVSFRIDSKNFDYGDAIDRGKIVAGVNLQWKKGLIYWKIPVVFVSECTSFVQSTSVTSLQCHIDEFNNYFKENDLKTFLEECEEDLNRVIGAATPENTDKLDKSSSSNSSFNNTSAKSKFERLQNYGNPPGLSPIMLTSQSKLKAKLPVLRRSFKS